MKSMKAWQAELAEPFPAGSRPMQGGLGRSLRLRSAMEVLPIEDRRLLLEALAEFTRPMTPRELEEALLRTGLPRGDRRKLVLALKPLQIVMVAA